MALHPLPVLIQSAATICTGLSDIRGQICIMPDWAPSEPSHPAPSLLQPSNDAFRRVRKWPDGQDRPRQNGSFPPAESPRQTFSEPCRTFHTPAVKIHLSGGNGDLLLDGVHGFSVSPAPSSMSDTARLDKLKTDPRKMWLFSLL